MGPLVSLLALGAAAHPVGDRAAAQSTVMTVHRDRVDVDFYADVPEILVRTARPGSADRDEILAAMATELASGLMLLVDGEVVSMRVREPSPPPRPSSEHTMGFSLHLAAPLVPGPHRIEAVTANLVDTQSFYAGDVRVDPGLVVRDCSLVALRDGRIARDDTLRWTRGEQGRRLSVTLDRPRPPWWSVLAGEPAEPRRAAAALRPRPGDLLRAGVLTPATLAASMGLAMALGAAAGRAERRTRLAQLAAALVGGAVLAVLPHPSVTEGLSGLAIGVALVAAARWPLEHQLGARILATAAVAGLAGATHAPLAAACVVAASALGGAASPARAPRATAAPAALAAGILLVRAVL
jgi:hypothetical protein